MSQTIHNLLKDLQKLLALYAQSDPESSSSALDAPPAATPPSTSPTNTALTSAAGMPPASPNLASPAMAPQSLAQSAAVTGQAPAPQGDIPLSETNGQDRVENWQITAKTKLIAPDADLNQRLHQAGFNQKQAQIIYDLAAEYLLPLAQQLTREQQSDAELSKLATHFGGEQNWHNIANQIQQWASQNLPEELVEILAQSYEGVLLLHRMMQTGGEPVLQDGIAQPQPHGNLDQLLGDPRYWRDRDPAFMAQVSKAFQNAYPG